MFYWTLNFLAIPSISAGLVLYLKWDKDLHSFTQEILMGIKHLQIMALGTGKQQWKKQQILRIQNIEVCGTLS